MRARHYHDNYGRALLRQVRSKMAALDRKVAVVEFFRFLEARQ